MIPPVSAVSQKSPDDVVVERVETPVGALHAALSPSGLGRLSLPGEPPETCVEWARRWYPRARLVHHADLLDRLREQLGEYFEGRRRDFALPLDLRGTAFQARVWQALCAIPWGRTSTYADVAHAIGRPRAVRAVGVANGANPVPIVVPCHRVVGSDGRLTGYGGGLALKRRLLTLEGALADPWLDGIEPLPGGQTPSGEEDERA
jgi:O-6-methylguanine DNA methyltransferase